MKTLWSPWRSKYIETFKDEAKKSAEQCFFCEALNQKEDDKKYLVAARRENSFIILNKFPYNNGHLLVAPNRHVGDLTDLTDAELSELIFLVREAETVLRKIYKPHGFNIGVNIGRTAGAGVPGHMHFHILPRWDGDTSFTATIDDIKVVSEAIETTYDLVSSTYRELFGG